MRLTGYDLNGAAACASVFEDAALAARDQDAADYKPKIPTEVKKRHLLACFLIMAKHAWIDIKKSYGKQQLGFAHQNWHNL